jgi:microcystin-dependent protein
MTQPFLGEIRAFPWDWPVRGWALCQGQQLSIQQNAALFSLLGTTYGGNGVTTFALPDFRSCVSVSFGQLAGGSLYTLGERTGTETVTLNVTQIPQHVHLWKASTAQGNQAVAIKDSYLATPQEPGTGNLNGYAAPAGNPVVLGTSIGIGGGSQPHSNIQPYLALNYSIALQGIFPSRN